MSNYKFKYPFLGIGNRLKKDDIEILFDVAEKATTYTQGRFQNEFEKNFKEKFNLKHVLAVSNAASGIELIADELNINDKDEVLCPAHTYCASAYPFLKRGAKIKWIDIDPKSWLSELEQLENQITEKTKAIILVHLYGTPAEASLLYEKLNKKNIFIIEDCAQSLGAKTNNELVGTKADFAIFSFQSHKNISTLGEGGIIATRHKESFLRMKRQRHNGHTTYEVFKDKYWKPAMSDVLKVYPDFFPSNFCLNEFSCAMGTHLLSKYDLILKKRKLKYDLASTFFEEKNNFSMQYIADYKSSAYHLLPIQLKTKNIKQIDNIIHCMANEYGVQLAKQYMPLYRYKLFNNEATGFGDDKLLTNTDNFYDSMVSIPFHGELTEEDIFYQINSLVKSFQICTQ